jgi:hypothetical protein
MEVNGTRALGARTVLIILLSVLAARGANAQGSSSLSSARILEWLRAGVSAPRLASLINESACMAKPLAPAERDALRAAGATAAILNGLDRLPECPAVGPDGIRRDAKGLPVSFMLVGPGAAADPGNQNWWRQLNNTLWVESFGGGGLMTLHQLEWIDGSEPGVVIKRVDGRAELFIPATTHPRPTQVRIRRTPSGARAPPGTGRR